MEKTREMEHLLNDTSAASRIEHLLNATTASLLTQANLTTEKLGNEDVKPNLVTPTVKLIDGRNQNVSLAVAGLFVGGLLLTLLVCMFIQLRKAIEAHCRSK